MYFSHLIGSVGLCFNRGLDTGMIAIRIGNRSSEGAGWLSRIGDIRWNLCIINHVPSLLMFVPRLKTPSNYELWFLRPWYCGKVPQFFGSVGKRPIPCCVYTYFVLPYFSQNCILGSDPCVRLTRLLAGSRCMCVRYSRLTTSWLTTWSSERNRGVSRRISLLQAVAAAG